MNLTPAQSHALLGIARRVIVERVAGDNAGCHAAAPDLPPDPVLRQAAGCFVSLHEVTSHRLRGCVGRIEADRAMAVAVESAAALVLADPRFTADPVTPADLPLLELEVSLLSPLRPAADPLDFHPLTDGIVLTVADRRGLFLPQVARETGWTRQQLLSRLCLEKLELPADAWQDELALLETFSTAILGPERLLR